MTVRPRIPKSQHTRRSTARLGATGSLAAAALVLAACSGGGGSADAKQAPKPAANTAGTSAVAVKTGTGPLGTFLTDATGRTLYMFASDTATKSTCNGSCVTFWPPLKATGTATATGAVKGNLLGTIKRADGSMQVSYDGHPLYYFKQDTKAGLTTGQGSDAFGAKWWVLTATGMPITSTGAATAPGDGY